MKIICSILIFLVSSCGTSRSTEESSPKPPSQTRPQGKSTIDKSVVKGIECQEQQRLLQNIVGDEKNEDDRFLKATNGVKGGGASQGSLDVLTVVDSLVFRLDAALCDGPGDDIVIFENVFGGPGFSFQEPALVSISQDGKTFFTFPHGYNKEKDMFFGLAGINPVFYNSESDSSAFAKDMGGDSFDLSVFYREDAPKGFLKDKGVSYIKISPFDFENECSGSERENGRCPVPSSAILGTTPDIDGVAVRYAIVE